jgi:hypothetical protein
MKKIRDERTMRAVGAAASDAVRVFDLLLPLCRLWAEWLNAAEEGRGDAADAELASAYRAAVVELRRLAPHLLPLLPDELQHRPGWDLFWECGTGEILTLLDGFVKVRGGTRWEREQGRPRREGGALVAPYIVSRIVTALGEDWTRSKIIAVATGGLEQHRKAKRDKLRTGIAEEVKRREGKIPACFDGPIVSSLVAVGRDGTRGAIHVASVDPGEWSALRGIDPGGWTTWEIIFPDGARETVRSASYREAASAIVPAVGRWCQQTGQRLLVGRDGRPKATVAPPQPVPRSHAHGVKPAPILVERDPAVLLNRLSAAMPYRLRVNIIDPLADRHLTEIVKQRGTT